MSKTLNINFYAESINAEQKAEFMTAIEYEAADMTVKMLNDQIARLDGKIANKNGKYTPEEVSGFIARQTKLEIDRDVYTAITEELSDTYNAVVSTMTVKNADHFGNSKDTVRTILRVLATWDNSKLVKYVIIPAFQSPALYEALQTIHVTSKAGDDGQLSMTKEVKEAYKAASKELESIIKNTFSLPFETAYTAKTRVKITAADKKLLNDCYVKGFSNKFIVDEDTDVVSFKKRTLNTLVKAKKDRTTGEPKYDYSGLSTCIVNIVMQHYFA